jgi:hypothetical protein
MFENQSSMDQLHGFEAERLLGKVDAMKFEARQVGESLANGV